MIAQLTELIETQGWMTDRLGARPLMLACLGSFTVWNALMCVDVMPYPGFLVLLVGIGVSSR